MVYRTINKLFQRGAEVIYDPIESVHVSGHARREEMRLMINLVQPRYFVPVHGELRLLRAHAQLAIETGIPEKNVFVIENGMVLEVDNYGVRLGERVPGGYVFVDGSGVGDIGRAVIRDREILARDGFIVVSAMVDRRTGKLLGEPQIISRGFIYLRDADALIEQIRNVTTSTLQSLASQNGRRREKLEENISRLLYNETKRRPMVFTILNEV
ncbi:MAG: ribonuclease J [Chloroflexi bacterium]|nr:MAG: ribonuclease J [Chloroflexota bacterium]